MEYKTYKLGTCFSLIENGAIIKQRKEAKGFPITRIETLSHGKFNRDKLGHADIFDTTPYKRYILEDKDLIMSHINSRAFLGRTVLYRKKGNEQIIHGMNVLRIKTNELFLDPVFASYLFKTSHFKKAIDSIRKDAINQSSINIFDICNIQISLPSITEQRKISHALQLIDKKIETNHLINDNLEAMAKQLYDYWFVQFDFPNEEGKPYKSSGGAMVWNEKLKREIPKGWSCESLQNICSIKRGASPRPIDEYMDSSCNGMPWVKISDATVSSSPFLTQIKECIIQEGVSKSVRVIPNTLIVSNSATPGIPKFIQLEACVHDGWLVVTNYNEVFTYYLYYVIKMIRQNLLHMASGSIFKNLKTDYLKEFICIIPHMNILELYHKKVEKIMKQILNHQNNTEELTKLRDELLPLLMNGQAVVNSD